MHILFAGILTPANQIGGAHIMPEKNHSVQKITPNRQPKKNRNQAAKAKKIMHYRAAVAVFGLWRRDGLISREDFYKVEGMTAEKYGILLHSIYRIVDLPEESLSKT
jgi:hypothetical protein